MTTPKNTKVELEVHISESGGYWALRVESHNPKSAVRIFKNLHKEYCPTDMEKNEEKSHKIIGYL